MTYLRCKQGTTLLEILLALGLGSLIIAALLTTYMSAGNSYQKLAAYSDAQYSARSSLDQIGQDIRGACVIEIIAGGTGLSLLTSSGDLIRYWTENDQLYRVKTTSLGTAKVPIAEQVSFLSFAGNAGLVTATIDITVDDTTYRLSRSVCSRIEK